MCLVGSLFARGVEWTCSRSGDRTNDGALGVGHRSVIWVLVVCDHGARGLWFGAGTGIFSRCLDEHLVDGEGALRRTGRGSGVWVCVGVMGRGEGRLYGGMGGRRDGGDGDRGRRRDRGDGTRDEVMREIYVVVVTTCWAERTGG